MIDFFEGILKITNVVLSLVAGYIALNVLKLSKGKPHLRAWKILTFVLIGFMIQEILGALRAFNIYSSPYLTHVVPTGILVFLIYALALQIYTNTIEK